MKVSISHLCPKSSRAFSFQQQPRGRAGLPSYQRPPSTPRGVWAPTYLHHQHLQLPPRRSRSHFEFSLESALQIQQGAQMQDKARCLLEFGKSCLNAFENPSSSSTPSKPGQAIQHVKISPVQHYGTSFNTDSASCIPHTWLGFEQRKTLRCHLCEFLLGFPLPSR